MEINLHKAQSDVFRDIFVDNSVRYGIACCSRGWGKSYLGATTVTAAMNELLQLETSVPNKNVHIVAPTLDQCKEIYYPILAYEFGLESYAISYSRDRGYFKFPKGVQIKLTSFESIERLRGKGSYYVLMDEIASWSSKSAKIRDAWQSVIKPTITTRWSRDRAKDYGSKPGMALGIGTPKGYNYFYDMFNMWEKDGEYKSYHYDYLMSPYLDPNEVLKQKDTMTDVEFASEYLAQFKESGLLIFYCFDRKVHVKPIEPFREDEVVYLGIDFNVAIQATTAFRIRDDRTVEYVKEFKGSLDTETLAIRLKKEFPNNQLVAFPDPSGRARKTSAAVGRTDFNILEEYGIRCIAHNAAPSIVDSAKAVNRKLMTANGKVSLYVSPECPNLIASLERTSWLEGDTATIDKSEGVEHFSDTVRYPMEYLFPVNNVGKRSHRGFGF